MSFLLINISQIINIYLTDYWALPVKRQVLVAMCIKVLKSDSILCKYASATKSYKSNYSHNDALCQAVVPL